MRFVSRTFRKKRKSLLKRRITKRRKTSRIVKGGANTFNRNIPKKAVLANPMHWDDDAYYDLAASEEILIDSQT